MCKLVGVDPTDHVSGLPPVDSVDAWPSLLVPNANASGRDEIFLSYSCSLGKTQWPAANASGCDLEATSIYGTSGDPTGGQASGDSALISGQHKIIFGQQQGRGIWFGPVFPNVSMPPVSMECFHEWLRAASHDMGLTTGDYRLQGTKDNPAFPCVDGCLFNIFEGNNPAAPQCSPPLCLPLFYALLNCLSPCRSNRTRQS